MKRAALVMLGLVALCGPRALAEDAESQLATMGYYGDDAADKAGKAAGKCPGAADGSELVGHTLTHWTLTDWRNGAPLSLEKLRGRVVVVRFWTSDCPFCEKSMPALQRLATEFRDEPVTFVGAFTAKPEGSVTSMDGPLKIAKGWGVTFPLAIDRQWRTLRSWYLDGYHRHATSATFVIGKDGRIVYVHPGPVFFPTDVAADADKNRDFLKIRDAIAGAVAKRS